MGAIFYQHGNEAVGDVLGNPACWPRIQGSIAGERRNKARFFYRSTKAETDSYNVGLSFKKACNFSAGRTGLLQAQRDFYIGKGVFVVTKVFA